MHKHLKNSIVLSFVWTIALSFWSMMRQFGQEVVDGPPEKTLLENALFYSLIGTVSAILFLLTDAFLRKRLKFLKSFGALILVGSFFYLLTFLVLIVIGVSLFILPEKGTFDFSIVFNFLFSKEGALLLFYFFFILLLIHFVRQVDKKFGPGNLLRMFKGEFYQPQEVTRIVMFLDLKSSTTIAEKIGHIKFSRLLQDCFNELHLVKSYQAEIYQYVGDEVVLIWEKSAGLEKANCIEFYFAYCELLNQKADYFLREYGVVPSFKCGSHIGKVIMTEIGQIKREIAYHGDVMNTAARIQGECNKNKKRYLVSEVLAQLLDSATRNYRFQLLDTVALRGKTSDVNIYSVEEVD